MTTWTDKRKRFSVDVPQNWSCPSRLSLLFSSGRRVFRASDRYLAIENGVASDLPMAGASAVTTAWALRETEYEIGSSLTPDGQQQWAVYRVPRRLVADVPAAREMLGEVLRRYADVTTGPSTETFLDEFERKRLGPVIKRYLVVLGTVPFELTCALGFGTVAEARSQFREKEREYDAIAASMRHA